MPRAKYDLFIFDWDGTLSTSTSLVKVSRYFQRRYSIDHIRRHGKPAGGQSAARAAGRESIGRLYAKLYDFYSKFSRPKLQRGALDLLKTLRKRHKKVAIFSDSNRYRLMSEVRLLGVLPYVDLILSADSIKRYKPNPDGLFLIMRRFKVPKERSIYIGDMASDIMTSRFAGISVASVSNGVDPYALLKEIRPDYLFRNLGELSRSLICA